MEPRIVGLPKEVAQSQCEESGFRMRIVEEDGEARVGTMEYRANRINVIVRDGRVQEVTGIG